MLVIVLADAERGQNIQGQNCMAAWFPGGTARRSPVKKGGHQFPNGSKMIAARCNGHLAYLPPGRRCPFQLPEDIYQGIRRLGTAA